MQRTKLTFEMINLDDDYIVDQNSIFINGVRVPLDPLTG